MNNTISTECATEILNGFELALTEIINSVSCEFYKGNGFDGVITREKLGAALGYSNPRDSIAKIHRRHKERLNTRSGVASLSTPEGGTQQTMVYSLEGALEICRWSRSPAADIVMDSLYAVFKKLLTAGSVTLEDLPKIIEESIEKNTDFVSAKIVPALQNPKLNQRELIGDIVGINGDWTPSGRDIEKHFEMNFIGKTYIDFWEKENKPVLSVRDLPQAIIENPGIMHTVTKWSRQSKFAGVLVNYCGKIYFDCSGLRMILNHAVKQKVFTAEYAEKWIERKSCT